MHDFVKIWSEYNFKNLFIMKKMIKSKFIEIKYMTFRIMKNKTNKQDNPIYCCR